MKKQYVKFSQEIADEICELIANSNKGLFRICKDNPTFPSKSTILEWVRTNEEFSNHYARARQEQAHLLAEEILMIADDISNDTTYNEEGKAIENKEWINRARLKVDTRKWVASKLLPKIYSDKMDISSDGKAIKIFNVGFSDNEQAG